MKFEHSPKPPSPRTQNHDNHQASSDSHDCHWQLPPTGLTSGQKIPGPSCSAAFLLAHTDRSTKVTVPGPFTMSQQAQNDQYPTRTGVALADALNEETTALFDTGVDGVQTDEPYMQSFVDDAREYTVEAINPSLVSVTGTTVLHTCFGYGHFIKTKTVMLGVIGEGQPGGRDAAGRSGASQQCIGTHTCRASHRCTRLRNEIPTARCRVRQAGNAGRRCRHCSTRTQRLLKFALISRNLEPRNILVEPWLTRQPEHLLTDDVAHDFRGAALDRIGPNPQEAMLHSTTSSIH